MSIYMPQISYLNASEHQLNLSFSEILFLRDFCRSNDLMFCSTMGGCESIRDLQESKYLGADATEYPYIESQFALAKIFSAMGKVFADDKEKLEKYKIFINIGSMSGLQMLTKAKEFNIPKFLKKNNIVFTLDRIKLTRNIFSLRTRIIDLVKHETTVNKYISDAISYLDKAGFSHCISGEITIKSLERFNQMNLNKPNFIKLGLFTIKNSGESLEIKKSIQISQGTEAKLVNIIIDVLMSKIDYLNERMFSINNDIYESL